MTTNIPLNFYETLANNPYSDYPCVKHVWSATNLDTPNKRINDPVGDAVIQLTGIANNDGSKADLTSDVGAALVSGSFTQPGTKSTLLLTLGNQGNGILNIGSVLGTTGGIQQAGSVSKARVGTSTLRGDVGTPVFSAAAIEMHGLSWVPATETRAYRLQSNGTYDGDNGTADITNKPLTLALENISTFSGLVDWNASVLLTFDVLPSAELIEEAMRWQTPLWQRGEIVIYPGLKGL